MGDTYHWVMKWINNADPQTTFLVLIVALVAGFLCLRGFGSRSSY